MAGPRRRAGFGPGLDPAVGVGPYPEPWPEDPRLDPELLAAGDRRNVVDRYRYWTVEAIRADLDRRRHPFHVAVENWLHDPNIGAVVRNANAFLARAVHVVGERKWNRRGAMMTEVYQHVRHHPSLEAFAAWARGEGLPVVGIDNLHGSRPLPEADLPRECVLLFGQEGPGLSPEARELAETVLHIPQFGSTRSINAGAASAVAMYEWCRRWARPTTAAVVPAAGRSRRMGEAKLLLPVAGGTVLGATLAALAAGGAGRICVVARTDDDDLSAWLGGPAAAELARRLGPRADRDRRPSVELVAAFNPDPERGMLSSVLAGLDALAAGGGPWRSATLLVCPGDLPALAPATVAAVVEALAAAGPAEGPGALAVPVHGGRRGHPLAISPPLAAEIPDLDPEVGLRQLLERHPDRVLAVPVDDPGCVRDLDTPEEYRELQRQLRGTADRRAGRDRRTPR